MKKIALITGITGQDGSYLAELLLNKGYVVHGVKRRSSMFNTQRIDHIFENLKLQNKRFFLHFGDLIDSSNIIRLISEIRPNEIYNLAAMSHVKVSFEIPEYVANTDAIGTLRILEAIRILGLEKKTRIYQASTSELYGNNMQIPLNEESQFYPNSPYAVAKLYSYWIMINYRKAYNIFAANGILFNHESPRRGETFVTRKITIGIAKILYGLNDKLYLGNLDAVRDWGHAKDYVDAMWRILQHKNPQDWVIATGLSYSIREFLIACLKKVGLILGFRGKGLNEIGYVISSKNENYKHLVGKEIINVSEKYFRPSDVNKLVGDASKARQKLDWKPKSSFDDLVEEMITHDMQMIEKKYFKK